MEVLIHTVYCMINYEVDHGCKYIFNVKSWKQSADPSCFNVHVDVEYDPIFPNINVVEHMVPLGCCIFCNFGSGSDGDSCIINISCKKKRMIRIGTDDDDDDAIEVRWKL